MEPRTVFTLNSVLGGQFHGKFFLREKGKEPESTMETCIRFFFFFLYDITTSEIIKIIESLIVVFTVFLNKFVQTELPAKA